MPFMNSWYSSDTPSDAAANCHPLRRMRHVLHTMSGFGKVALLTIPYDLSDRVSRVLCMSQEICHLVCHVWEGTVMTEADGFPMQQPALPALRSL
eukprot:4168963-Amphidinium_carterae.1